MFKYCAPGTINPREKITKSAENKSNATYTKLASHNDVNCYSYKVSKYLQGKDSTARGKRWPLADESGNLREENKRLQQENE